MVIKIRFERRVSPPKYLSILYVIISILSAFFVSGFIFKAYGINPILAYRIIFTHAYGSPSGIYETIVKAIPLILCSVGLSLAFKAEMWNIGAEGQLLLGAIMATGLALFTPTPPSIIVPVMFIGGFMAGALWAVIPAILKVLLNVNEVITTMMMNYIAIELVRYLIYGPWRGSKEWGYPITDEIPDAAKLICIPGTRIHIPTLAIAISTAFIVYLIIMRTTLGYEIRVAGENPEAARYAGISYLKISILSMIISGGLAGIAGVGEIAGIHYRLRYPESISMGYGFTSIIVAWLGRLNPISIIIASIFFGGLLVGGYVMKMILGLPVAVVYVFNGITLMFILVGGVLSQYKIKLRG